MSEPIAVERCRPWVIHVIPAIAAYPVRPESGHSANARVYEYTAYGTAENRFS